MEHDLEHISQGTLCEEADVEKCKEEHDGPDLDWACEHCPKLPAWRIHPYTQKLLNIRRLQAAGFPIDADMLTYDEWLDLGRVNQWLTPAPFM